jgi:molybdopterin-guanine dinucleotide biosynthesis protein A
MIIFFYRYVSFWEEEALANALQHLKHNKHKVVLFHVVDTKTELVDFDNTPRKFIDIETGEEVLFCR